MWDLMRCMFPDSPAGLHRVFDLCWMGVDGRLSLGLFVLLMGVWYCYKRGKEERLKEEEEEQATETTGTPNVSDKSNQQDEVLVEGTHAQDTTDHGLGNHITPPETQSHSPAGLQETSVLRDTTLNMVPVVAGAGDGEDTDTPLQIESDVVPSHGPSEKKIKQGWLR